MPHRIPSDPDSLARALADLQDRVERLERAPVIRGSYRLIQRNDGALVWRHLTTGHETTTATPS